MVELKTKLDQLLFWKFLRLLILKQVSCLNISSVLSRYIRHKDTEFALWRMGVFYRMEADHLCWVRNLRWNRAAYNLYVILKLVPISLYFYDEPTEMQCRHSYAQGEALKMCEKSSTFPTRLAFVYLYWYYYYLVTRFWSLASPSVSVWVSAWQSENGQTQWGGFSLTDLLGQSLTVLGYDPTTTYIIHDNTCSYLC